MSWMRKVQVFLYSALAVGLVSATASAGETYDRIKKTGEINIGFANEAPYAYTNPDGSLSGFSYDLAQKILTDIGVKKINGVVVKFGALIPSLVANRFDIVVAGMAIRPARCEQVAFSEPDMQITMELLVPKGNPKNLHSYDDVIKSGAVVAVLQGGSASKDVRRAGVPEAQIKEFPDFPETIGVLKAGRVDGTAMTATTAGQTVQADGAKNFERASPWTPPVFDGKPATYYSGYAFRLEDKDLLADFNKALLAFKGSPDHVAILEKYGLSAAEIPPAEITAVSLCSS